MPGATPSYPPEFKRETVRLVRSSPKRSVAQIARELGVSDNSLRNWVKQFEIDQGERVKSEIDMVGLLVWHAEKGQNGIHLHPELENWFQDTFQGSLIE